MQLLVCRAVVEISIANVWLHILNNFLVIWDKVALDESDIMYRLTPNTRNTVLPETEYFENRVPKPPCGCRFNTVFSNILVIQQNIPQYNVVKVHMQRIVCYVRRCILRLEVVYKLT